MSNPFVDEPSIHFRSGFSIFPSQVAQIEKCLTTLLEMVPAKMILLVDTSGQFVTGLGDYHAVDTAALGSLIAGDHAASQEIARMTGEYQEFQLILREGERSHIMISEAGSYLIFLTQFAKDVPLGWARKLIQRAALGIGDVVQHPADDSSSLEAELSDTELPDLFSDALDDIWKG
jgi:hypothetical protein